MPRWRNPEHGEKCCGNCRWYVHHPSDYLAQRNPEFREKGRTLEAKPGMCANRHSGQNKIGQGCHCDLFDWAMFDEFI